MLINLLFPTEEDRLLLTIVDTDHDQDLVPTAQDAIDKQSGCSWGHLFLSFFSLSLFLFNSGFPQASNPSYSLKRTLKTSLVYLASTLCRLYCCFHPFYYILKDVIVILSSEASWVKKEPPVLCFCNVFLFVCCFYRKLTPA